MASKKLNCWEYMKCGREPEGKKAAELGICRAATDMAFEGLNGGRNGGRICWAISGTFCGGNVQGSFAEKKVSCTSCDFFKLVHSEERIEKSGSQLMNIVSPDALTPFLDCMTFRKVKAAERFIKQGENGVDAYIIQSGSCIVNLEKGGQLYSLAHLSKGDIVGEMAILTGEPRSAHVDAETDMELLGLNRSLFDEISKKEPELLNFMTELVTDRLESNKHTANRLIGKYIATDIIGHGGYSIVYKGVHSSLNMSAAIKMMKHNLATDPDFLTSFRNEAKIIASLNHEHIIKVYDIEEAYRTIFIIVEHLEGETLDEMLKRVKTLSIPRTS